MKIAREKDSESGDRQFLMCRESKCKYREIKQIKLKGEKVISVCKIKHREGKAKSIHVKLPKRKAKAILKYATKLFYIILWIFDRLRVINNVYANFIYIDLTNNVIKLKIRGYINLIRTNRVKTRMRYAKSLFFIMISIFELINKTINCRNHVNNKLSFKEYECERENVARMHARIKRSYGIEKTVTKSLDVLIALMRKICDNRNVPRDDERPSDEIGCRWKVGEATGFAAETAAGSAHWIGRRNQGREDSSGLVYKPVLFETEGFSANYF